MVVYIRPSGSEIELQDTKNHANLAGSRGWVRQDGEGAPANSGNGYLSVAELKGIFEKMGAEYPGTRDKAIAHLESLKTED